MKKLLCMFLTLMLLVSMAFASAESYTAVGTGRNGDVPVTVTMEDSAITAIEVGENQETPGVGDLAIATLPDAIVAAQSLSVDAVAGATLTSEAILSAVEAALTEAGLDVEAFKTTKETALAKGETVETDIVIVGAGLAGLMAAYELKENYPEVSFIVLEKLDMITGSIPGSGGAIIATSSVLHSADGLECSVQDVIDLFEFTSGAEVNEVLVGNVDEHSDITLDRLVGYGADFQAPTPSSKYSETVYAYWHNGGGAGFAEFLRGYVANNGFDLRTSTRATELIVEDGSVVGVHVEDKTTAYDIRAKAVILATGVFGSSETYMEEYLPLFADGFFSTNAGATGDGITMTAQFGTKVFGDGSMGSIVAPDGSALINSFFMVNSDGERFIGEGEPKYVVQRAVSQQKDKAAWLIADSTYEDMDTIADKIGKGYVKQYDTIEELAANNGINVENLLATVNAYNQAAEAGEDIPAKEFALAAASATPIQTAPFYIEKVTLRTFGTIPGIEANGRCQILDGEGNVIDGLYGVGELIAGNAFTRQYPGAGVGISWAANTGRYVAGLVADGIAAE